MKTKHAILAASFIGMAAANAAVINWSAGTAATEGAFGETLSTGLFDTSGTEFLAENIGGAATTFDGINFAAGTTGFDGTASVFHDSGASPLSLDGAFGNAGSAGTVSLTGLTIGNSYSIQALVFDGRGATAGRTVEFDGIDQGQYANGVPGVTWGAGLLVTGTFVADATSQDFTVEGFNGATSVGAQLNGIYVQTIPEPSSTALLGLGGLALILRRRK